MKICKNNFDICLCNINFCRNCSFLIGNGCKWHYIVRKFKSECGGVKSRILSDIFTL